MQSLLRHAPKKHNALNSATYIQCRNVSLTGAIEKGIRKARYKVEGRRTEDIGRRKVEPEDTHRKPGRSRPFQSSSSQDEWQPAKRWTTLPSDLGPHKDTPSTGSEHVDISSPCSMPYSTAGSEFIYGTFAVEAALRANRRKLYKLYLYKSENGDRTATQDTQRLRQQASAAGVTALDVGGEGWKRILSRMSETRPHNGVVLEASALPRLPVTALQRHRRPDDQLCVKLGHQLPEEQEINNSVFSMSNSLATIPTSRKQNRHPFLLLLDRIMDSGNLGAIMRSAYYLGADGIIVLEHGTAPLSAIAVKASGGATEYLPVLRIKNEVGFIQTSQENGWKFCAAVSPESTSAAARQFKGKQQPAVNQWLRDGPCVLMLGNEGEGLRPRLEKLADGVVSIAGAMGRREGVDSLNVSVAAALLLRDFLVTGNFPDAEGVEKGLDLF